MSINRARAAACVASGGSVAPPFHGHQWSGPAWPSSVPLPVTATFFSPNA